MRIGRGMQINRCALVIQFFVQFVVFKRGRSQALPPPPSWESALAHYRVIRQRLFYALALLLLTACATRLNNAPVVERSGGSGYLIGRQPSLNLPPGYDRIQPGASLGANAAIPNAVITPDISATPVTNNEVQTQPLNGEPLPTATPPSPTGWPSTPSTNSSLPTPTPTLRPDNVAPAPENATRSPPEQNEPLASETIALAWPVQGPVLGKFDERKNKGLNIGGSPGTPIRASAGGRVVYAGNGLRGYGNLIIIKHDSLFLSAYAHNRALFVREGDIVTKGQKIAEMGNSDSNRVMLHFEVRRQGKPIDPFQYLPPQ